MGEFGFVGGDGAAELGDCFVEELDFAVFFALVGEGLRGVVFAGPCYVAGLLLLLLLLLLVWDVVLVRGRRGRSDELGAGRLGYYRAVSGRGRR